MKLSVGKFVEFRSAILNAGFRVSISHCNKQAIKTDAPIEVVKQCFKSTADALIALRKISFKICQKLRTKAKNLVNGSTKLQLSC